MSGRRLIVNVLVGSAVVMVAGYALFALPALRGYYTAALSTRSAELLARDQPVVWAVAVGAIAYSALVALAIRAQAPPVGTGALVGLLLWVTADFMLYGISLVGSMDSAFVDPLFEMVPGAAAGWTIATMERWRRTMPRISAGAA